MSEKNLIPFPERTESEQRKIAQKGGKASGRARRRKKELRDVARAILETVDVESGKTVAETATIAIIQQALKGNVKAYECLRDTAYGKPVSTVEMTGKGGAPIVPPTFNIVAHE